MHLSFCGITKSGRHSALEITCTFVFLNNILFVMVICRNAEDRLEECQVQLAEKESQVKKQREEIRNSKADLVHEIQCRQR